MREAIIPFVWDFNAKKLIKDEDNIVTNGEKEETQINGYIEIHL